MAAKPEFTINQMRVICAVRQQGSISRTAHALSVPQSAISRAIARVEDTLGVRLFDRSGRGVATTPAGDLFVEHAVRAIEAHDLAFSDVQQFRGRLVGEVRIAAPESFGNIVFAPLIKHFQRAHPDTGVRTIAAQSSTIPSMLDTGTIDLGIVANTHPTPAGTLEMLCAEELHLIGPRTATEMRARSIELSAAAKLPLILNAMPGGFRTIIDRAFAEIGSTPNVRIEIDANNPLIDLVLSGEGFSILPYSLIVNRPQKSQLRAVPIRAPKISRKLLLAGSGHRSLSPVARKAAQQIATIVKQNAQLARWHI